MPTLVRRLVDIGLIEYEARATMALLRLGRASGYQVAKESGVLRSTVYEVLAKLGTRLL